MVGACAPPVLLRLKRGLVKWRNGKYSPRMPKRLRKQTDPNQLAASIVQEATTSRPSRNAVTKSEISRVMALMGRKGGRIGGKRRMVTMTATARREAAANAARARWAKVKK